MNRLVAHDNPEARPTPLLLLADLREIDRTIELVYVGDRIWWMGSVRANAERQKKGELILSQMMALDAVHHQRPTIKRNLMLGRLLIQGFARIEAFTDHGDPAGVVTVAADTPHAWQTTMKQYLVEADHHWKHDGEAVVEQRLRETSSEARKAENQAEMNQYLATDGRAHYKREVKNRVQFGHGGMTGGSGRLILPGMPEFTY